MSNFTPAKNYNPTFMNNLVTSQVLGQLIQDEAFDHWWNADATAVPFFDNKIIPFIFTGLHPVADTTFIEEADTAIRNFLSLTISDRNNYSDLVYENCTKTLEILEYEDVSADLVNLDDPKKIWHFVSPSAIYVSRRSRRDMDIYINVSCNCDWEEEHGLQLVFRQGKKLTRVSEEDGHLTTSDAYDILDEQDELLSTF